MTKKAILKELRELGIKATYQNICWCHNKSNHIVGGILYARNNQTIYFKVENEIVSIVKSYNDIRLLIVA